MINWNKYLNREIVCSCGKKHQCNIKHVDIGFNVIKKLADYVQEEKFKNICIVADKHTIKIAGEKVYTALKKIGISYNEYIFTDEELIPNELNLGKIFTHIPVDCDFIIAIGSGVINDLVRFVSKKIYIPYAIVATAPSMDGYASAVSPLIIDGFKVTYEGLGFPWAIIGDVDILKDAPVNMIASGVGDIFGKYVCLVEWKLSHIVNNEYYCPEIEKLMRRAVDIVAKAADHGIAERDPQAIASVMEGLIWAGIGISYCGNSRPASGCEHQMGHFWEMMFLQNYHRHDIEHGTFVGIATIVALYVYKEAVNILEVNNNLPTILFDKEKWEKMIVDVYGKCSCSIIDLENKVHKNDSQKAVVRIRNVLSNKMQIIKLIKSLPDINIMIKRMKKVQEPFLPRQIGITPQLLRDTIIYAKEMRNRYGVLQLLFDCGKLEEAADKVCREIDMLSESNIGK
ncbi:sn-glycerol-1-phosphate dehydrogenase [Pectinatus sottacetonis]|uniref:sn-glycerol-1-phosphate dehydrogenase n=1 Tax=Pectinatus sottacetonis TaxID=1002795 RepID=UPI0018C556E6